MKIKASPPKNSIFFYSTPPLYLNVHNLHMENSMLPQPGGVDIKSKIQSPKLLTQKADIPVSF